MGDLPAAKKEPNSATICVADTIPPSARMSRPTSGLDPSPDTVEFVRLADLERERNEARLQTLRLLTLSSSDNDSDGDGNNGVQVDNSSDDSEQFNFFDLSRNRQTQPITTPPRHGTPPSTAPKRKVFNLVTPDKQAVIETVDLVTPERAAVVSAVCGSFGTAAIHSWLTESFAHSPQLASAHTKKNRNRDLIREKVAPLGIQIPSPVMHSVIRSVSRLSSQ